MWQGTTLRKNRENPLSNFSPSNTCLLILDTLSIVTIPVRSIVFFSKAANGQKRVRVPL